MGHSAAEKNMYTFINIIACKFIRFRLACVSRKFELFFERVVLLLTFGTSLLFQKLSKSNVFVEHHI